VLRPEFGRQWARLLMVAVPEGRKSASGPRKRTRSTKCICEAREVQFNVSARIDRRGWFEYALNSQRRFKAHPWT